MSGNVLFYGGLALMAVAAAGGLVTVLLLSIRKKRLDRQLEEEYGKKPHL